MRNKLFNIHYFGGCGGEFIVYLLGHSSDSIPYHAMRHKDYPKYENYKDRGDLLSQFTPNPKATLIDWEPRTEFKWNMRWDHGYGFDTHINPNAFQEWQDLLYNDWYETKTLNLNSKTQAGCEYIRTLGYIKIRSASVGHGKYLEQRYEDEYKNISEHDNMNRALWITKKQQIAAFGEELLKSEILAMQEVMKNRMQYKAHRIWENPYEVNQELTEVFERLIPKEGNHDYIHIDCMDLLHGDDDTIEKSWEKLIDFLGWGEDVLDICIFKSIKYREENIDMIKFYQDALIKNPESINSFKTPLNKWFELEE